MQILLPVFLRNFDTRISWYLIILKYSHKMKAGLTVGKNKIPANHGTLGLVIQGG